VALLETAGAFATVVQLIAIYKDEHARKKDQKHQDFIEWLDYHRHEELKNLICTNAAVLEQVTHLIQADTRHILARLEQMNGLLVSIANGFEEFQGLAQATHATDQVMPETMALLRNLGQSGARKVMVQKWLGGRKELTAFEGARINFEYDKSHLEDDLETLADIGFLRKDFNAKGEPTYIITRRAEQFAEASQPSVAPAS
jgi:hypothetical protein